MSSATKNYSHSDIAYIEGRIRSSFSPSWALPCFLSLSVGRQNIVEDEIWINIWWEIWRIENKRHNWWGEGIWGREEGQIVSRRIDLREWGGRVEGHWNRLILYENYIKFYQWGLKICRGRLLMGILERGSTIGKGEIYGGDGIKSCWLWLISILLGYLLFSALLPIIFKWQRKGRRKTGLLHLQTNVQSVWKSMPMLTSTALISFVWNASPNGQRYNLTYHRETKAVPSAGHRSGK